MCNILMWRMSIIQTFIIIFFCDCPNFSYPLPPIIDIVGYFTTIFEKKEGDITFFNLLRQNAVDIDNPLLCTIDLSMLY